MEFRKRVLTPFMPLLCPPFMPVLHYFFSESPPHHQLPLDFLSDFFSLQLPSPIEVIELEGLYWVCCIEALSGILEVCGGPNPAGLDVGTGPGCTAGNCMAGAPIIAPEG